MTVVQFRCCYAAVVEFQKWFSCYWFYFGSIRVPMIDLLNCVKRVDCPECDASYCQECDFLNQNQGKLHVDHPLPIVFYACSYITLCIYACIGLIYNFAMMLSYLPMFCKSW